MVTAGARKTTTFVGSCAGHFFSANEVSNRAPCFRSKPLFGSRTPPCLTRARARPLDADICSRRWRSSLSSSSSAPAPERNVDRSTRVQRWGALQHELLASDVWASERHRSETAAKAWRATLRTGDIELCLPPERFVEFLQDVVYFPAFSVELHKEFSGKLRCTVDAFGEDRWRRQFFHNEILRLYLEKAVLIRGAMDGAGDMELVHIETMDAVVGADSKEQVSDDNGEDFHDAWYGVLNTVHVEPVGQVDILLHTAQAPEAITSAAKDDLCILRLDTKTSDGVGGLANSFFGEVTDVKVPHGSDIVGLRIRLRPLGASLDALPDFEGCTCRIVPISFPAPVLTRQQDAIFAICDGDPCVTDFVQTLVLSRARKHRRQLGVEPFAVSEHMASSSDASHNVNLNSQQRAAVEAAETQQLTLIEGPPGTGKTHVAVAIVTSWLQQDPHTPILVATGTHTAKDLIVERLERSGMMISFRFDDSKKVAPQKTAEKRGPFNTAQPLVRQPVFVETVYTAAVPEGRSLPRVLIDESSQIATTAALVALTRGCEKLVLIGDPQQLGPVSILGISNPASLSHATVHSHECMSFFERVQVANGLETVRLTTQYRMDPRIRDYPSRHFYNGDLQDADDIVNRGPLPPDFPLPAVCGDGESKQETQDKEHYPVVFVDTSQLAKAHGLREERVRFYGTRSRRNRLEASIILQIVKHLEAAGVPRAAVSVLTAYGAQREHLLRVIHGVDYWRQWRRNRTKKNLFKQYVKPVEPYPKICTVDGFQGCEADFILFSPVRSNEEREPGFVGDPRRVCVLLTRARRGLVVVGDERTLSADAEWGSWLQEVDSGRVRRIKLGTDFMTN